MGIETPLDFEILVVGAGLSGIATGIKLKKAGFHDFSIIEKADGVGGTWRDNSYPGLAVDIPTLTYSYSFEQNPDWSNLYAPGPELKDYADHCTDKYGVRAHIQFNRAVSKAVYDEERNVWQSHLEDGSILTVYYITNADRNTHVAATRWHPDDWTAHPHRQVLTNRAGSGVSVVPHWRGNNFKL